MSKKYVFVSYPHVVVFRFLWFVGFFRAVFFIYLFIIFFFLQGGLLPAGSLLPVHAAIFSTAPEEPALPGASPASPLRSSGCERQQALRLLPAVCRRRLNSVIKE